MDERGQSPLLNRPGTAIPHAHSVTGSQPIPGVNRHDPVSRPVTPTMSLLQPAQPEAGMAQCLMGRAD